MFPVADFLSSYWSLQWKLVYHVDPNRIRIRVTPYSPFTPQRLHPSSFSINMSGLHQRSCELGGQTNVGVLFSSPTGFAHPQLPVYCERHRQSGSILASFPGSSGSLGSRLEAYLLVASVHGPTFYEAYKQFPLTNPIEEGLLRLAPSSDLHQGTL